MNKLNQETINNSTNKKTDKDFISGYVTYDDFIEESIHATNLYDGVSILTNYTVFELIRDSITTEIESHEENIALCYKIYKNISETCNFLITYQDEIKEYVKKAKINEFSLEEINDNTINLYNFNNEILYNGHGLTQLDSLKEALWRNIESSIEHIRKIEIIDNKFRDVTNDEYLEDTSDITEELIKNYSKLDYDRLNEFYDKKTKTKDKDSILEKVRECCFKYDYKVNNFDQSYYTAYVGRNFSGDLFMDYFFITNVYNSNLKDLLASNNEAELDL